jgi:hypothetical protein
LLLFADSVLGGGLAIGFCLDPLSRLGPQSLEALNRCKPDIAGLLLLGASADPELNMLGGGVLSEPVPQTIVIERFGFRLLVHLEVVMLFASGNDFYAVFRCCSGISFVALAARNIELICIE